jgi:Glycosyl transferase family 2
LPAVEIRLTAVLAAKDEEDMIEGALRSLHFCDEIVVVVDDRTTDRTEEIARRFTDKVLVERFSDFAQIRNAGISASTGAWILHIDADERVTPALAREIREALAADPEVLAFRSPTINFFWGRRMDHGGWSPMVQPRLVRREHATFRGRVHETTAIPPERIGTLRGERWHFSHRSIEENLVKAIRYGRLEARDALEAGAGRVSVWSFVRVMALEFGRRMIRRRGYRDGMPGVIEATFQPFAMFCAQVMLWELQQGDAVRRRYEALERQLESER